MNGFMLSYFSDLWRMTDWSVVPIVSNLDIETLSLSESDIHDVTAVRMAAKLSENVCIHESKLKLET
jgi:hypothetical protein